MINAKRVLITGSAGSIGRHLCRNFSSCYAVRGFDRLKNPELDDQVIADLSDLEALKGACDKVDVVVHLAGNRSAAATWDELLESNIKGTHNVFEAARLAGVGKVVFASSCQVTFGYGEHHTHVSDLFPRPISMYGVSKVNGEMIGHAYAHEYAMDVICIRVGLFTETGRLPAQRLITGRFLGHRDAVQLFRRAIDVIGLRYAVVYGASASSHLNLDLDQARRLLGYVPEEREDDLMGSTG